MRTTSEPAWQRPAPCRLLVAGAAACVATSSLSQRPAPPPSHGANDRHLNTIAVCVRLFAQLRQLVATTTPRFGCGQSKCAGHCTAIHSHEKVSSIKMNEHPATCAPPFAAV